MDDSAIAFFVFFLVVIGVLGLLVGSFLNVVIYRVPNGRSVVSPPSACPTCGAAIKPWDNVPVLSWLVLRGKCRSCRSPISVRYPIIELATGIFFAVVALRFIPVILDTSETGRAIGSTLILVAFLYLAAISIALAMIDIDTHRLPNSLVVPSYIVGAVLLGIGGGLTHQYAQLLTAPIGAIALFVFYFLLALVYPRGMGFGDVKLAGVLGLCLGFLGFGPLIVGAFAAFLLGGLFAIALLIARRAGRKSGIPFGPWMLGGAWIGVFFGQNIAFGYLSIFGLA